MTGAHANRRGSGAPELLSVGAGAAPGCCSSPAYGRGGGGRISRCRDAGAAVAVGQLGHDDDADGHHAGEEHRGGKQDENVPEARPAPERRDGRASASPTRRGDGRNLGDGLRLAHGFRLGVGHRHDRGLRHDHGLDHDGLDHDGLDHDCGRLFRGCRPKDVDARGVELRLVGRRGVHGIAVSRQSLGVRDRSDIHGHGCRRRLGDGLDRHRVGDRRRLGDRLGRRRDGRLGFRFRLRFRRASLMSARRRSASDGSTSASSGLTGSASSFGS